MSSAITVHEHGDPEAPTVILLHGLSDAGTNFPDLVTRWQDDWRILAPDMRGHGTSPRFAPEEMATSGDLMLDDVLALVDAQPVPVVLLGHSMGGALALRAAVARPDRVRAVVLEDPPHATGRPRPADVGAGFATFVDGVSARVDQLADLQAETGWSGTEVEPWARSKPQVQRAYLRAGLHLGSQSWADLISTVTVPTLLVLPDSGSAAPDGQDEDPRSPQVREVVIADAGHCVRRDQPEAYHRAVEDFLAEVLGD